MARLHTTLGTSTGATGTLVVRELMDDTGDGSLLRPSVLYGLGTGLAALAARYAVNNGIITAPVLGTGDFTDLMTAHAVAGIGTGITSALIAQGSGQIALPTV